MDAALIEMCSGGGLLARREAVPRGDQISVRDRGALRRLDRLPDAWLSAGHGSTAELRELAPDDSSYRIVGVLSPGASYPRAASVWTPHALEPYIDLDRSVSASIVLTAIARPRTGVTDARIRAELDQQIARGREVHPELRKFSVAQLVTRPLAEALAGEMRPILFAILASSTAAVVSLDAIRFDPPVVLTLFVVIVTAGAISSVVSLRRASSYGCDSSKPTRTPIPSNSVCG